MNSEDNCRLCTLDSLIESYEDQVLALQKPTDQQYICTINIYIFYLPKEGLVFSKRKMNSSQNTSFKEIFVHNEFSSYTTIFQ